MNKLIYTLLAINALLLLTILFLKQAYAGPYVDVGLGWSPFVTDKRCNEICFRSSQLGIIKAGYHLYPYKGMRTGPEYIHVSGIDVHDKGFDAWFWTIGWEWK